MMTGVRPRNRDLSTYKFVIPTQPSWRDFLAGILPDTSRFVYASRKQMASQEEAAARHDDGLA
jgi:hypothetical protein